MWRALTWIGLLLIAVEVMMGQTPTGEIAISVGPLTKPSAKVTAHPFAGKFEKFQLDKYGSKSPAALASLNGLYFRNADGDSRTEFLSGPGEFREAILIENVSTNTMLILYKAAPAGMEAKLPKSRDVNSEWIFPDGQTTELAKESLDSIECRRFKTLLDGGVSLDVWIADDLKAVIKEVTHSPTGEQSIWRLFDLTPGDQPSSLFRAPSGYTILQLPEK